MSAGLSSEGKTMIEYDNDFDGPLAMYSHYVNVFGWGKIICAQTKFMLAMPLLCTDIIYMHTLYNERLH